MAGDSLLAGFEALAALAAAQEASAPCGLSREGLARCTKQVESECPLRKLDVCPRQRDAAKTAQIAAGRDRFLARGVPDRVLTVAYDRKPVETPAIIAVRQWLDTRHTFLVLSGPNQCGKTTAAGWAMLSSKQPRMRFLTVSAKSNPSTLDALLAELPRLDLVVLDDLGSTYFGASGFAVSAIERMVDAVYQGRGRCILCTDVAMRTGAESPFFNLVGQRVASRLLQAGKLAASLGGPFQGGAP